MDTIRVTSPGDDPAGTMFSTQIVKASHLPNVVRDIVTSLAMLLSLFVATRSHAIVDLSTEAQEGTDPQGFESEPSITIDPLHPTRMVVASQEYDGPNKIAIFYTENNGASWHRQWFSEADDGIAGASFRGDPSCAFGPVGDTLYVAYIVVRDSVRRSVLSQLVHSASGGYVIQHVNTAVVPGTDADKSYAITYPRESAGSVGHYVGVVDRQWLCGIRTVRRWGCHLLRGQRGQFGA